MLYTEKSLLEEVEKIVDNDKEVVSEDTDINEVEESVDIKIEEEFDLDIEKDSLSDYVNNHYLESVLDPMAKDITAKIIDMKLEKDCNITDMIEIMEAIGASNWTNSTKNTMIRDLIEAYNVSNVEYDPVMESVVLEFSGDPEKNKEFMKVLDITEKFIKDRLTVTDLLYKLGDKIIANMNKVHDKNPDAKKIVNNCINDIDDYIKEYNTTIGKDINNDYKNGFAKFRKLRKKFNNKYSSEVLEYKKKIDEKLDVLYNEALAGEIRNWMQVEESDICPKWAELVNLWEDLKRLDRDEAGRCVRDVINPFATTLANNIIGSINLIRYVRYYLDIEAEGKITYKFVQKVFKDKKKDNEKDDLNDKFELKPTTLKLQ